MASVLARQPSSGQVAFRRQWCFTLLAARIAGPSGRVVAIEPSPYAASRLEATARANSIEQIEVHRIGLSDTDGSGELHLPPELGGNHTPNMNVPHPHGATVRVDVKTLDEALVEWKLHGAIDLMKMDVEGHEPRVLRGGARALKGGRVKAMLCELNGSWLRAVGSSRGELVAQLRTLGFAAAGAIADLEGNSVSTHIFHHS